MPQITYATSNPAKVRSLRRRLRPLGFTVQHRLWSIPEPRLDRVEEVSSFKAMFAFQELRQPLVVNDAAFHIDRLRGFPGTNVKFGVDTIDLDGMIRLAADSPCHFRHALSYYDEACTTPMVFADSVTGTIADRIRGQRKKWHWSRLCLIFIPTGCTKTLGEMTEPEWSEMRNSDQFGHHYADQFATWYHYNRSAAPTLT